MALPDLTGLNIQDTYQRLLQVSSSGEITDGTGSLYTPLSSSHAISASYAVSASHEIIKEISSSHADIADNLSLGVNINIGHITASGDISASGNVIAPQFHIGGDGVTPPVFLTHHVAGDNLQIVNGGLLVQNNITASGNISASGNLIANNINGTIDGGSF